MERLKYLGFESYEEMKDEFERGICQGFNYQNKDGVRYYFNVEEDGRGWNVVDENGLGYYKEETFTTFEDMVEHFVFPDGVRLKDAIEGENWQ